MSSCCMQGTGLGTGYSSVTNSLPSHRVPSQQCTRRRQERNRYSRLPICMSSATVGSPKHKLEVLAAAVAAAATAAAGAGGGGSYIEQAQVYFLCYQECPPCCPPATNIL